MVHGACGSAADAGEAERLYLAAAEAGHPAALNNRVDGTGGLGADVGRATDVGAAGAGSAILNHFNGARVRS